MRDITVLIPVHNAEKTIAETLDSLEMQTYHNFEILIVNDASNDNTAEIIHQYQSRLPLEVLTLSKNLGVAGALNAGISNISTPYIARIDADDIALPTRLEMQIDYLNANQNIDVCSTWMEVFSEQAEYKTHVLAKPLVDAVIKTSMLQYCSLSHPSTMIRGNFFKDVGVFNESLDFAEDYDLWCRGALLGKCYSNLPDVLTRYRKHDGQVSIQKRQLQYERDLIIKRKYISALLGGESAGYLAEFFSLLSQFINKEIALSVIEQSTPLLFKLEKKVHDEKTYHEMVANSIKRHMR
jgi:glycosyltransferase involved in cell wall biosynthesis